ncbi:DUF5610 domain-containing protein [Pseudoalteromonas sp. A3]|uniref:Uncharacterized protein n=1 Tax=Pseudoalteromonas agarivorans DSM 14585 TaxID=1312369 RepID=A0ACA8E0Z1_9GAMM|nr:MULTISPECIES: DUF5610 domain-containing protein [Pseudoalteromonas]ATC83708.1 hypothetical protein PAGA_a3598 [Pseudoalteromonas agarivorans DSM 14585]MCK8097748.1 DUF5610 domain-containing protein [Pseudoalteromonas sp. 1CM17D]MCW1720985.1 DUF5610 domain-containing protein [Pseudoalteromonas sp. A3]|tara:strand:- start:1549 stop:2688 length:1140 start_codon:yes stop_codon:yes gene_type:complete
MKIGNYGYTPNNNVNKFNNKEALQQPTIQSPQESSLQRGRELAAKVLGDKMAEQLGLPVEQKQADKPLFDFDEIVKNVLDFVSGAVNKAKANGADDDKLKNMLDDARSGVQTGIDEAVDELKGTGVFNEEMQEGIDKSKEGIFEGLDEFEQTLFNPQAASVSVSQAQYVSMSSNAEYKFTTAEGDEVSISFADAYESQTASGYQQSNNSESFASSSSQSRELSFSMSVNGDLNEQEQDAINAMMEELQGVSKTFFSGDLDEAFEKAQELSLGSEQLVAFSMDLRQTKTVATVKSYEQYQPNPSKEVADAIAPFNDDLKNAFDKASQLGLQDQLAGIIEWLNQDQAAVDQLVDYTQAMFENLNQLNSAGDALDALKSEQS